MSVIQWFPGHMKKTLRELKAMLSNIDIVLYLLDGRAPLSSINPSLETLANKKPILYIINKIDLADKNRTLQICREFEKNKKEFVLINSTTQNDKIIKSKILKICDEKIKKSASKNIKPIIRAVVVGIPNCGKSTFINSLVKKAKLVTGNKPGVTKQVQWIKIGDNIELCDTPGTLYPNLKDQEIAKKLFYIGSVKDEILVDICPLAQDLLNLINQKYPNLYKQRYGDNFTLEDVAKKRNYILSKDTLDIERTANAVIDDFRKGRIGKITLD